MAAWRLAARTGAALTLMPDSAPRRREQQGIRPCVVVTDPEVLEDQRFPMLCVVPITKTPGEGALYPALSPGKSGLRLQSYALVDQDELMMSEEGPRLFLGGPS